MFIDRLRESSNLCVHPNDAFDLLPSDNQDMYYKCRLCNHSVSVTDFLCRIVSPLWSATLAREFAEETGLVNIPCKFVVDQFPESLLPETVVTRLSIVLRGLELLKAIHTPFVVERNNIKVNPKLFEVLLTEYMSLIDRVSSECDRDQRDGTAETVKLILTNMKDAFSNVDMFDQYFNVLVPYVERAAAVAKLPSPRGDHLGAALHEELQLSSAIRKTFSPYCIPFDIIHGMVLCYLCGDHIGLIYNIVLNFASKLCCGYFSFPISEKFQTGIMIRRFLDHHMIPSKNKDLYYHLKKYLDPDTLVEHFSEAFLIEYGQLESKIRKNVPLADNLDKIDRFVYQQTFPYMLFERNRDDSDYYAFVMALSHYASKSNLRSSSKTVKIVPGTSVPKGVEGECKRIYRFVKSCMMKVKAFTLSGEKTIYWTKDIFELFVASDSHFSNELTDIISIMIPTVKK